MPTHCIYVGDSRDVLRRLATDHDGFRMHGLAVEALLEPRPAPGVVSSFWPTAGDWAQRWPAELIWKVRREP